MDARAVPLPMGPRTPLEDDFKVERVAGDDGALEPEPVDAREVGDLFAVLGEGENRHGAHLGQRLDDEDAGDDGIAGEVPLEEGFVDGELLEARGALPGLDFEDTVHQQKGRPVGDDLLDGAGVEHGGLAAGVPAHRS